MSIQKAIVERYTQGFRTGDLVMIAACLADDVVWALHGDRVLSGKDAFIDEAFGGGARARATGKVRASEATGRAKPNPELILDRLIEEAGTVVAVGHGSVDLGARGPIDFVYSEVFTFTDDLVSRLDTFHVWLGELSAA